MIYVTEIEIRERIGYLARYMRDISPKVSLYAQMKAEKKELQRRFGLLMHVRMLKERKQKKHAEA